MAPPHATAAAPAEKPLRSDAARNRKRLLTAAIAVLSEQGLDAGVEEIAARAGVGVGTLYRRFPDKDALISELVQGLLDDMDAVAGEALARADGHGLEQFLRVAGELFADHRGCLPRLWTTPRSAVTVESIRARMGLLLADAQRHGTVARWVAHGDITAVLWALRGIVETTFPVAPDAWRRQLEISLAGLRAADARITEPALTTHQLAAISDYRPASSARAAGSGSSVGRSGGTGPP